MDMTDSAIGKYYFSQTNFSMLHQVIRDYFAEKYKIRIGKDFNNIILDCMKHTYAQKDDIDESYTYNINDYISALNRPVLGDVVQQISERVSNERQRPNASAQRTNLLPNRPATQDTSNRKNHGTDLRRLMDERADLPTVPNLVDSPAFDAESKGLSDELYGSLQPDVAVAQNSVAGSHRSQEYIIPRTSQQQLPSETSDSQNNTMELFERVQKLRTENDASLRNSRAAAQALEGRPTSLPTIPEEDAEDMPDAITEQLSSPQQQSDNVTWTPLTLTDDSGYLPIGADFDNERIDIMPQMEISQPVVMKPSQLPSPRSQPELAPRNKSNDSSSEVVTTPVKLLPFTDASLRQLDLILNTLNSFPQPLKGLPGLISDVSDKLDLIADRALSTHQMLGTFGGKADEIASLLKKKTVNEHPLRSMASSLHRESGCKTNKFTMRLPVGDIRVLSVYIPQAMHLAPLVVVKVNDIEQTCELEQLTACDCCALRVNQNVPCTGTLQLQLTDLHGCLIDLPNDEKVIKSCASTASGYLFGTEEPHGLRYGEKAHIQHLVSDDSNLDAVLTDSSGHKVLVVDAVHFEIIMKLNNKNPLFRTFGQVRTQRQQVQIMYDVA